jgi:hypothetical protein
MAPKLQPHHYARHPPRATKAHAALPPRHPDAPQIEAEIVSIAGFKIIGFPGARPLTRELISSQGSIRYDFARSLLALNGDVIAALQEYANLYGLLAGGLELNADTVAAMIEAGVIALRGRTAQSSSINLQTYPLGGLTLSGEGKQLIFKQEGGDLNISSNPYWPKGKSGVTIGAGYDMGARSTQQIIADLNFIGVDLKTAVAVSDASLQVGLRADDWVKTHKDL